MQLSTRYLTRLMLLALVMLCMPYPLLAHEYSKRLSSASVPQTSVAPVDINDFLDDFFAEQMSELHIPGAVIVVVQNGETILSKGYGFADLEEQVTMDPEKTVMQVGSVSKLFVATAVMQLVEKGQLNLHSDVNNYIDSFQLDDNYPEPVTLAHLLTHTAGFDDLPCGTTDPNQIQSLGAYLSNNMPPRVIPTGEIISYSNHGYALAAYIVEQVSKISFDQYVSENILQPLGMDMTEYLISSSPPTDLAVGYLYENDTYTPQPIEYIHTYPAGALISTANDIAKFMLAHLQNGCMTDICILQPETMTTMQQQQFTNHPQLPGWTYGFIEGFDHNLRIIGHSGAIRGFISQITLIPEYNLGYFVAINHECTNSSACLLLPLLRKQVLDRYFPVEDPPSPEYTPSSALSSLTGNYRHSRFYRSTVNKIFILGRDIIVTAGENSIIVNGAEYIEIAPLLFHEISGDKRIAFRKADNGTITYMFLPEAYEKLAWYQTSAFNQLLFNSWGWLWGAIVLVQIAAVFNHSLRKHNPNSYLYRSSHWLIIVTGVLNVLFVVSLIKFFWISKTTMSIMLVLPLISTTLTSGLIVETIAIWVHEGSPLKSKLFYLLISSMAVLFLWFLRSWNFLGFHLS